MRYHWAHVRLAAVGAELLGVDGGRVCKSGRGHRRGNELARSDRRELPNFLAVASDDEGLAAINGAHDLAALVTELALTDSSRHLRTVAPVLH